MIKLFGIMFCHGLPVRKGHEKPPCRICGWRYPSTHRTWPKEKWPTLPPMVFHEDKEGYDDPTGHEED